MEKGTERIRPFVRLTEIIVDGVFHARVLDEGFAGEMINERMKSAIGGVVGGVAERIGEKRSAVCGEQSGDFEKIVTVAVHEPTESVAVRV